MTTSDERPTTRLGRLYSGLVHGLPDRVASALEALAERLERRAANQAEPHRVPVIGPDHVERCGFVAPGGGWAPCTRVVGHAGPHALPFQGGAALDAAGEALASTPFYHPHREEFSDDGLDRGERCDRELPFGGGCARTLGHEGPHSSSTDAEMRAAHDQGAAREMADRFFEGWPELGAIHERMQADHAEANARRLDEEIMGDAPRSTEVVAPVTPAKATFDPDFQGPDTRIGARLVSRRVGPIPVTIRTPHDLDGEKRDTSLNVERFAAEPDVVLLCAGTGEVARLSTARASHLRDVIGRVLVPFDESPFEDAPELRLTARERHLAKALASVVSCGERHVSEAVGRRAADFEEAVGIASAALDELPLVVSSTMADQGEAALLRLVEASDKNALDDEDRAELRAAINQGRSALGLPPTIMGVPTADAIHSISPSDRQERARREEDPAPMGVVTGPDVVRAVRTFLLDRFRGLRLDPTVMSATFEFTFRRGSDGDVDVAVEGGTRVDHGLREIMVDAALGPRRGTIAESVEAQVEARERRRGSNPFPFDPSDMNPAEATHRALKTSLALVVDVAARHDLGDWRDFECPMMSALARYHQHEDPLLFVDALAAPRARAALPETLEAIRGERLYQRERWGAECDERTPVEFVAFVLWHATEAMRRGSTEDTADGALDSLRKVAALCLAALDEYGPAEREREGGSYMPDSVARDLEDSGFEPLDQD